MSSRIRPLAAVAVLGLLLWPLAAFYWGPVGLGNLAAAPYVRSLKLGVLTALGALLLGLPAAWAMTGAGARGRWLRAGALAVLLVPPYLAASAWMGVAWRLGLLSLKDQVLAFLPLESPGFLARDRNLWAVSAVLAGALWPCVALPAAASLAAIGRDGLEAARLARGRWGCFRGVELPAALPAALVGAGVAFALALAELGAPDLFMVTTAARDVLKGFESAHDYSQAAGRSLPLVLGSLVFAAGLAWAASRRGLGELARARFRAAGAPRWAVVYAAALLAVTLGAVLAGLTANAGGTESLRDAVTAEFGLVARSLFLALLSAAVAVVLGGILVWSLPAGRSAMPLAAALGLAALTLVLPGTLWGLGLLRVREGLSSPGGGGGPLDTPLVMVLAGAARAAAGVTAVLAWGALRLNPEMLEAARTAGLPPLRRLLLTVGLMRRWVVAALLVGVALALGEVGASVMICPPGWETLAVRVFAAMHNGHGQVTAALALVTTAGAALFGVLAAVAGRGGAERC